MLSSTTRDELLKIQTRGSTLIASIYRNHSLDYNGVTGPDWGHSEGVFRSVPPGMLSAYAFFSVGFPQPTLLFNVFYTGSVVQEFTFPYL